MLCVVISDYQYSRTMAMDREFVYIVWTLSSKCRQICKDLQVWTCLESDFLTHAAHFGSRALDFLHHLIWIIPKNMLNNQKTTLLHKINFQTVT